MFKLSFFNAHARPNIFAFIFSYMYILYKHFREML